MAHTATLPTRRERLRAFCQLKFEHRLLRLAGLALLATVALLALMMIRGADPAPEAVPLGRGIAGVDPSLAPPRAAPAALPAPERSREIGGGEASFYGNEFAGRPTASGETFNPARFTAAHRTLPLGSKVRVTHARTGQSVVVRINDRGPFHGNRAIDLSEGAARRLGMLDAGTARVRMSLLT